jgi:diguanylate cyclase (GGDEF)-like protein
MGQPPLSDAPDTDERHICCTMSSVVLRLVRAAGGESAVAQLMSEAGSRRDAAFLEHVDNWISLDEAVALLTAASLITGDNGFARRVGEEAVNQLAGTQVATLLRSLGSPEAVMRGITVTATKFSGITDLDAVDARPGWAEITSTPRQGFGGRGYVRHPVMCEWTKGLLSQPTVLFGLPPARVEESECQTQGAPCCRYIVSWDAELASADAEERVTALEAQMVAMSKRLDSAFATASELVSPDDLDTVLARIVERAASAVRAPGYVLAVRPTPDAEMRVYGHGFPSPAAQELAYAELQGEDTLGESALRARVVSSRCDYGELVALNPAGMGFFPQEQQLLTLYARHAAAVLDMTTALENSAKRSEQVAALLSLAHALAQAGTRETIAARLAEAVPDVVECDLMSVWLWDQPDACLRPAASSGLSPDQRAYLDPLKISPSDTPYLEQMLHEPQPLLLTPDTGDAFTTEFLSRLGVAALLVVPIVARSEFLGLLNVGVTDHPERLALNPELQERLTGVAALAAPALANGGLLDQLHHDASHDNLTGLLNRAGFARRISGALAGAGIEATRAGLLYLDLDGFKAINDGLGHEAGDDLLCQAAERLRQTVRGSDTVARMGGDEFAIVLAGAGHEEVRAAAARVQQAFEEPFSVGHTPVHLTASVGAAKWPSDGVTVEALVKHADGEMYRHKARSAGDRSLAGVPAQ